MSENQANIVALIGATGQGKSATFKQWLDTALPSRLILLDPMDEYGKYARQATSLVALAQLTEAATFAARYVPKGERDVIWQRFDVLCAIAYQAGNLTLGVEELSLVTAPGGGPAAWGECTLRGRHKGLTIVGLSQRPALVDKNFFSNATRVRCFRLNFAPDVATMAGVLGVAAERVQALRPLQYLERDMATGELSEGAVTFAPVKPARPSISQKKKVTRRRR